MKKQEDEKCLIAGLDETAYLKDGYDNSWNALDTAIYHVTDYYKSSLDELYDRIMDELKYKYKPIIEHKCNNCGAPLEMDIDNHLFKCRYCGTAYLIGTKQINAR